MKLSGPVALIKKSFSIFFEKENFLYFVKVYALLVPFALYFLFQGSFINTALTGLSGGNPAQIISKFAWFLWISIPVGLIYFIISFWITAAGIKAVANVVTGTGRDVKGTLQFSWKVLWRFSLLSLLFGLILFGGAILLVIPAIIFGVWYGFASYIFMSEGKGIIDSLKASKRLVDGRFWKVFGRLFVFGIFGFVFQIVFSLIPFGIGNVISPLFAALLIIPQFLLYKELSSQSPSV